eukprot:Sspe_Gene.94013::Locus_66499_Transcript_1_1_Confidence_1.000_Length_1381::g.94013::m.94013
MCQNFVSFLLTNCERAKPANVRKAAWIEDIIDTSVKACVRDTIFAGQCYRKLVDLYHFYSSLAPSTVDEQAEVVLDIFDNDRDGLLSYEEFMGLVGRKGLAKEPWEDKRFISLARRDDLRAELGIDVWAVRDFYLLGEPGSPDPPLGKEGLSQHCKEALQEMLTRLKEQMGNAEKPGLGMWARSEAYYYVSGLADEEEELLEEVVSRCVDKKGVYFREVASNLCDKVCKRNEIGSTYPTNDLSLSSRVEGKLRPRKTLTEYLKEGGEL